MLLNEFIPAKPKNDLDEGSKTVQSVAGDMGWISGNTLSKMNPTYVQKFSYDQQAKLDKNPDLKYWYDNLSTSDQDSAATSREINNFGTEWATPGKWDPDGGGYDTSDYRNLDVQADNVIGTRSSNPLRINYDKKTKDSIAGLAKSAAVATVVPGAAQITSPAAASATAAASLPVNVAVAPAPDKVAQPKPVTALQPSIATIKDKAQVPIETPVVVPVPGKETVTRPTIHPELTAAQALKIKEEQEKTAKAARQALLQAYMEREMNGRDARELAAIKAKEIAADHAAKLEIQAHQNQFADDNLIELNRKLRIQNAVAEYKAGVGTLPQEDPGMDNIGLQVGRADSEKPGERTAYMAKIEAERKKTEKEAFEALQAAGWDEDRQAKSQAVIIAKAHADKLALQASQNEFATDKLIALNRKLRIQQAVTQFKQGMFDYDPEGSMVDDPTTNQVLSPLTPDRIDQLPGREGEQIADVGPRTDRSGDQLPGREGEQIADVGPRTDRTDQRLPGREGEQIADVGPRTDRSGDQLPGKVGGGELVVDPEARKAQLQDVAYKEYRKIMDEKGMSDETADRQAKLAVLQLTAVHSLANVEQLVDIEYQQKMKDIKADIVADERFIAKAEKWAEAERIRNISAIPPSAEVDDFSDIEKAEAATFVRNAVASTIAAIKNSSDYSGDDTEDFAEVRVKVTAQAIAAKKEFMKLGDAASEAFRIYTQAMQEYITAGMDVEIAGREATMLALNLAAVEGLADTELAVEVKSRIAKAISEFKTGATEIDPEGSMDDPDRFTGKQTIDGSGVSMSAEYQKALDALPIDRRAAADKIIAQMKNDGVSQADIQQHMTEWMTSNTLTPDKNSTLLELRRITAIKSLEQHGIPRDLATKIADKAIADGVETEAFIQQQVEYYNDIFKTRENAGITPTRPGDTQDNFRLAYDKTLGPDGIAQGERLIRDSYTMGEDGKFSQTTPYGPDSENPNPYLQERIDERIEKLNTMVAENPNPQSDEDWQALLMKYGPYVVAAGIAVLVVWTAPVWLTGMLTLLGISAAARSATGDTGDGNANVDDFSNMPLDFSDISLSELTSAQLNSEIDRVMTEMNTPGITRERFNELDKIFNALKKQKRKNRRSNS